MSYQYNIIYTAGGKTHKTHHSETVDFEIREEINGDILTLTLLPKTDLARHLDQKQILHFKNLRLKITSHFQKKANFL